MSTNMNPFINSAINQMMLNKGIKEASKYADVQSQAGNTAQLDFFSLFDSVDTEFTEADVLESSRLTENAKNELYSLINSFDDVMDFFLKKDFAYESSEGILLEDDVNGQKKVDFINNSVDDLVLSEIRENITDTPETLYDELISEFGEKILSDKEKFMSIFDIDGNKVFNDVDIENINAILDSVENTDVFSIQKDGTTLNFLTVARDMIQEEIPVSITHSEIDGNDLKALKEHLKKIDANSNGDITLDEILFASGDDWNGNDVIGDKDEISLLKLTRTSLLAARNTRILESLMSTEELTGNEITDAEKAALAPLIAALTGKNITVLPISNSDEPSKVTNEFINTNATMLMDLYTETDGNGNSIYQIDLCNAHDPNSIAVATDVKCENNKRVTTMTYEDSSKKIITEVDSDGDNKIDDIYTVYIASNGEAYALIYDKLNDDISSFVEKKIYSPSINLEKMTFSSLLNDSTRELSELLEFLSVFKRRQFSYSDDSWFLDE